MYTLSSFCFAPNKVFILGKLKTDNLHFKGKMVIKNLTMTFENPRSSVHSIPPFRAFEFKIFGKKKSLLTLNQSFDENNFQSFETKSGIKIVDFFFYSFEI